MNDSEYFIRFFAEKEIAYTIFNVEDSACNIHLIDSDTVIAMVKIAPAREQATIRKQLVELDFHNQSIEPYLRFLAECYVKTLEDKQNAPPSSLNPSLN